jgi:hypothetical protein
MKRNIIYLIIYVVFNFGCSKNDNINSIKTEPKKEIIPLKLGNSWVLEYTYYDTLGNVADKRNDTFKIDRDTIIQNEVWYWGLGLVRNKEDGLYTHDPIHELSWITFKYPATPNTAFQEWGVPLVVVSINDTVKINIGDFICYYYKFGTETDYTNWYLSPGVGIIKMEQYAWLNSGRIFKGRSAELKEYHLN